MKLNLSHQLATQLRHLYFGGNWTSVNFKDTLADLTWQQAITRVHSLNTIATLVFHTGYYINAVTAVLKGEPLNAKDAYSFDHPPIKAAEDWETLLNKTWKDLEEFMTLIDQFPVDKLGEDFTDGKYGSYYRNIQGIIEHSHYHLGQIAIIKKILAESNQK